MTKENFTSIGVIIDRSGSMSSLTKDTIGGYNSFIREQKAVPGDAVLTLALFDDKYDLIHDAMPLQDVPELTAATYSVRGSTALLDAIGRTIDAMGRKLSSMKEEERPSKVLVLIMTDGEENASQEYKHSKIKEMVSHQQDVYKWEFVFIGANVDSFSVGTSMGVSAGHTYSFSSIPGHATGMPGVFTNLSSSVNAYRTSVVGTAFNMADPINNVAQASGVAPTVTSPIVTGTISASAHGKTVAATQVKDDDVNTHQEVFPWGAGSTKK